ncbi:MAG: phosphoethanolamine--lipid A transferase [Rhizobacter sp.]
MSPVSRGIAADRPVVLITVVALWLATVGNVALWHGLFERSLLRGMGGWTLVAGLAVGIAGLMTFLSSLFAWRWTLKPVLVLWLMVSAGCTHFMLSYGMVMDPSMLVNVLQTDPHEAADLLSGRLAVNLLLLGVLPSVWVLRRRVSYGTWSTRVKGNLQVAVGSLVATVLALFACFQPLASTVRNHHEVRYLVNPLNVVYAIGKVAFTGPARANGVKPIGEDATIAAPFGPAHPPLLVLVLGETGRAGNFGVNGYERDTTPRLAREDIVSFRDVWSCGTSTAASVPCMFSRLGRDAFLDREHDEEGLLDVLQRAGYGVLWLDNQGGCKGVCDRVPNAGTCAEGECLDAALLDGLDARLAALPAERRARGVVLVLHQIGSHGPAYHRRSSPETKRFLPECTQNELQSCSRAELVNAYDNSIAYTDHLLGATIDWLKRQETGWRPALMYVADHGESLGENNLYLHGLPYAVAPDVQKRVPWITWMSPGFARDTGLGMACLKSRAGERVSHDHYFHSVLGLMGVSTSLYDPARDVYAPCRAGGANLRAKADQASAIS